MEIYALIGRSGTGKSYKAHYVAGLYDIEYILDDGLLIKGTKVIAGISAKRENTRIAAVKRAVFIDKEHRNIVKEAIREHSIDKLLIIGTSEHMIQSIIRTLELKNEYKKINIEDISEKQEIEEAIISRRIKGKHVIPVPTFEVKKDFSGYFIDSVKMLINRNSKEPDYYEKTVVRPTFSYLGKYDITNGAIKTIVTESAGEIESVDRVLSVEIEKKPTGIILNVSLSLYLKEPLYITGELAARKIRDNLEYMTGINIISVNISIKSIKIEQE